MTATAKLFSSSADRNKEPIAEILLPLLAQGAAVLELASGAGQHGAYIATRRPDLIWQPSDIDEAARQSCAAWRYHSGQFNLRKPLALDAADPAWPDQIPKDLAPAMIVAINMAHITPWAATQGLIRGAGKVLPASGRLFLYGPYKMNGRHTAPSNQSFDNSLGKTNPEWGLRDIIDIERLAAENRFVPEARHTMPANNFSLVFRKSG